EVARYELAGVVDEKAAIGVAVERDAEVGALLERLGDDELAVLGKERIRLVVRKRPVGLEEAAHRFDRQTLQDRRKHRAGHPVRGIDDDAQRLDRLHVDEREDLLDVCRPDVVVVDMSGGQTLGPARSGRRAVSDLEQAGLAAHGQGAGPDDLDAGVLLRVVGRSHGCAAVQPKLADGEVDHLGADEPEAEHVGAGVSRAVRESVGHGGARHAHVVADGDLAWPELLGIRTPDRIRPVLVELSRIDAPDVICLEDLRVEHRSDANDALPTARSLGLNRTVFGIFHASVVVHRLMAVERKLATVLFVDLVDSTSLVTGTDPEVARRRVTQFFERVSYFVTTHGGIVEKFAGDAVLAAFGVPQAHEDDAERAIRAALAMLDSVHELGLQARVGVESGEVVVDESESTFATGEAVTLAARLQQAAGPGEVLIGPHAYRLTSP